MDGVSSGFLRFLARGLAEGRPATVIAPVIGALAEAADGGIAADDPRELCCGA